MKKVLSVLIASLCLLAGCSSSNSENAVEKYGSDTLKVFTWGEYMSDDMIPNFEEKFGVKVIVDLFSSNEEMYTKLLGGERYDVLVPSDYMIERLMKEDKLQTLDQSLIPNMSELSEDVVGLPYDENNDYSIPYFWGSVGIVYNSKNVDPAEIEEKGWNILKDPKYAGHLYMYDSERDSFMVALKALGYSMNTSNPDEIQEAYEWLVELDDTMNPDYVTDEVNDYMSNGQRDLAVVYSGAASYIISNNPDMRFYSPSEGTNIWSDAMVIPADAPNPKLAHEFINYALEYDVAVANSEAVGYTPSNQEATDFMASEEGSFYGNEAFLPHPDFTKDEVFVYNPEQVELLSELWIKVKAH